MNNNFALSNIQTINYITFLLVSGISITMILLVSTPTPLKMRSYINLVISTLYQILSIYFFLFNFVLFFYLLRSPSYIIYCFFDDNSIPCSNNTTSNSNNFLQFLISLSIIFQFLIHYIIILVFYQDHNPFAKQFWSGTKKLNDFFISVNKMIVTFSLCTSGYKQTIFLANLSGFLFVLASILVKLSSVTYYHRRMATTEGIFDIVQVWYCFFTCLDYVVGISSFNTSQFIIPLAALPTLILILQHLKERSLNSMAQSSIKKLNSSHISANLILHLIYLIENKDRGQNGMLLNGIFRRLLSKNVDQLEEGESLIKNMSQDLKKFEESESFENIDRLYYQNLSIVISKISEKIKHNNFILYLSSCIERVKKDNTYNSVFLLKEIESHSPSFSMLYQIFKMKQLLQEDLTKQDVLFTQKNGLDIKLIVDFQDKFLKMKRDGGKLAENYLQLWGLVKEKKFNYSNIYSTGQKLIEFRESINDKYSQLSSVSQNNLKLISSYSCIQKYVMNEDRAAQSLMDLVKRRRIGLNSNMKGIEDMRVKFGENTDTIMIRASGNHDSLGIILGVSDEICQLGFQNSDLVGESINILIPKILNEVHALIMRRYFARGKGSFMNQETVLYPLDKDGYICPSNALLRILPTLQNGIEIVIFLRSIAQKTKKPVLSEFQIAAALSPKSIMAKTTGAFNSYCKKNYLIFGPDLTLYGVSRQTNIVFGINNAFTYGRATNLENILSLTNICPALDKEKFLERLEIDNFATIIIDTSSLRQKIVDSELIQEEAKILKDLDLPFKQGGIDDEGGLVKDKNYNKNIEYILSKDRFTSKKIRVRLIKKESFYKGKIVWYVVELDDSEVRVKTKKKKNSRLQKINSFMPSLKNSIYSSRYVNEKQQSSAYQFENLMENSNVNNDQIHRNYLNLKEIISGKERPNTISRIWVVFLMSIGGIFLANLLKDFLFYTKVRPSMYNLVDFQAYPIFLENQILEAGLLSSELHSVVEGILSPISRTERYQEGLIKSYHKIQEYNEKVVLLDSIFEHGSSKHHTQEYKTEVLLSLGQESQIGLTFEMIIDIFQANVYYVGKGGLKFLKKDHKSIDQLYPKLYFVNKNILGVVYDLLEVHQNEIKEQLEGVISRNELYYLIVCLVVLFCFMCVMVPFLNTSNLLFLKILSYLFLFQDDQLDILRKKCNIYLREELNLVAWKNKQQKDNNKSSSEDFSPQNAAMDSSLKRFSQFEGESDEFKESSKGLSYSRSEEEDEIEEDIQEEEKLEVNRGKNRRVNLGIKKNRDLDISRAPSPTHPDKFKEISSKLERRQSNLSINEDQISKIKGVDIMQRMFINKVQHFMNSNSTKQKVNSGSITPQIALSKVLDKSGKDVEFDEIHSSLKKGFSNFNHISIIISISLILIVITGGNYLYTKTSLDTFFKVERASLAVYQKSKSQIRAILVLYQGILRKNIGNLF